MIRITSIDDPRIAPYRNLKDRELARSGDRFIAEGEYIVRRLLASDYPCESIVVVERLAEQMVKVAGPGIEIFVTEAALLRQIIGFKFHSGVLAVGRRKPDLSLDDIPAVKSDRATLVICPELISAQNIGSLIRISAALGADAMLLGEKCCDPFWRQSIRISMGAVFSLPIVRSRNFVHDLHLLRERGFELVATVLDENAESLDRAKRRERLAILFGNESRGLDANVTALCDRRVSIPMRAGIDSLNVSIAAGIFLYHFTRPNRAPI
jgi:tRNA G18 (ribose-2'-O)-methylase SpoU